MPAHSIARRRLLAVLGTGAIAGAAAHISAVFRDAHSQGTLEAQRAAAPAFIPQVELAMTASAASVPLRAGAATRVWRYDVSVVRGPADCVTPIEGSYLGPTIRLRTGQRVRIRFTNNLPEPSILHMHGLHVPEAMDGHPRFAVGPGGTYVYDFQVVNRAGTYWYHPHHHSRTGPQVYNGLAGLLLVSDEEESALKLPSDEAELCFVLQDRIFDARNQLVYGSTPMEMMTGFLGDTVIVNGRAARDVPLATRAYRVRFLNGSNARIYKLGWGDGTPMTVLGSDGGLLEQPLRQTYVTLAPGERADVLLDLSTRSVGSTLTLNSLSFSGVGSAMGAMGAMGGMGRGRGRGRGAGTGPAAAVANGDPLSIATLRIARRERASFTLPSRLSTYDGSWRADGLATPAPKRITLSMQRMQWLLNGRTFEMTAAAPDETVALGSKEVWELDNRSGGMMQMAHPIHLHGRQFRVLKREIDPAMSTGWNSVRGGFSDAGWKDTVLVMPGERVQILSHFTAYRGLFLYHCHNLEHEDLGMMRNYRVS